MMKMTPTKKMYRLQLPAVLLILLMLAFTSACSGGSGETPFQTDRPDTDYGEDGALRQSFCTDGLKNEGELGIDCGGPCSACETGDTYYVRDGGDDDASGLTPGEAWGTVARVNAQEADQPGDRILFRRGDTWREELVIQWSGEPNAYITFGAYGEGTKPRILGSEQAAGWQAVSGRANVWRAATSLDAPLSLHGNHPGSIFFVYDDGTVEWGTIQAHEQLNVCQVNTPFDQLNAEFDWCWQDDAVYVYAPADPDDRYAAVEVPQRSGSITMVSHQPQQYITIDGLDLMYGIQQGYDDDWPMNYAVKGLNIINCHIAYIGIQGGESAYGMTIWHSDMLVKNNDIHDCGRRSISYNVYTDNADHPDDLIFDNVLFEGNVLHNGYHTTGFDISHGAQNPGTFRNFVFRNNYIWDDPADDPADIPNDWTSMGLFMESNAAAFVDFKVYNNIFKHLKQKSIAVNGVDNLRIFNNTIYGMNANIGSHRPMVSIGGTNDALMFNNNIVYGTVRREDFLVHCVYLDPENTTVRSMNHNLYFQEDDRRVIHHIAPVSYQMSDWDLFQTATRWDLDSPAPRNPLFVDAENGDFHLQWQGAVKSPAIDAGVPVPGRRTDFYGNPIVGTPDIGAIEFQQ